MLTPKEALAGRKKYVQEYAEGLVVMYSASLSTQKPDKAGDYHVSANSSPDFTDQEKEEIYKILEQEFTKAGWICRRTALIFSYKLSPQK